MHTHKLINFKKIFKKSIEKLISYVLVIVCDRFLKTLCLILVAEIRLELGWKLSSWCLDLTVPEGPIQAPYELLLNCVPWV